MGYIITAVGALFKAICDMTTGGFGSGFIATTIIIAAYFLGACGILVLLFKATDNVEKIIGVALSVIIWITVTVGFKYLFFILLAIIVLFFVDKFFLNHTIFDFFFNRPTNGGVRNQPFVWPSSIFSGETGEYFYLDDNMKSTDYAVYKKRSGDKQVTVYRKNMKRNRTVKTVYGTFTW